MELGLELGLALGSGLGLELGSESGTVLEGHAVTRTDAKRVEQPLQPRRL